MIYYAPRLACCPFAMTLAKKANRYLLRTKLTSIKKVDKDLEALFDVNEQGQPTAILCFFEEVSGFYISIAWVDRAMRCKGVFKRLMDAVVFHAKKNKAKYINTEVRSKNVRMLEVMSRHWDTSYVFFTKKIG